MSTWGILHAATLELTRSHPIKQRLTTAFSKHLKNIDPTQLPLALRDEYLQIIHELEAVPPMPGESAVQATVRKLSAEDAELIATRIVVLFGEFARASTPRAVEAPADAPRAERFAEATDNVVPLLYAAEA